MAPGYYQLLHMKEGVRGALLLSLLLCSRDVTAADGFAQYRFDHFSTSNGLPQNTVSAITQTRDGYLWFGTYDGLVRYDGVRFTIFDKGNTPGIGNNQFVSLHEDARGTLWAGTVGGGFVRYRDGVFVSVTTEEDVAARSENAGTPQVRSVLERYVTEIGVPADARVRVGGEDRDGHIWLFTERELIRHREGRFDRYASAEVLGSRHIRAVCCDREGTVWVGTNENGLHRLTKRFLTTYAERDGLPGRIVYPLFEDRRGHVWIGSGSGLARLADGRVEPVASINALLDAAGIGVRSLYEDRDGRIWTGLGGGRLVAIEHGRLADYSHVSAGAGVDVIFQDRAGALWVGTARGLIRMQDGAVARFDTRHGLPDVRSAPSTKTGRAGCGSARAAGWPDGTATVSSRSRRRMV